MASPANTPQKLDIIRALRTVAIAFWRDFAPIVMLGFVFLTLPSLLVHMAVGPAADPASDGMTLGTLLQTFTGILGMIFGCAVSFGVMAALAGHPLEPGDFIRAGLRASRPGLIVALIIGAAVMLMISVLVLARNFVGSGVITVILLALAIWLVATLIVAIPVAIAEQRQPLDALRRSVDLTRGNRGRIIGLILIATLAFLPPAMLVNAVIFGPGATMDRAQAILESMTLTSPGLWITLLFNLLVYGLLATVPAVIYAQLAGLGQQRPGV